MYAQYEPKMKFFPKTSLILSMITSKIMLIHLLLAISIVFTVSVNAQSQSEEYKKKKNEKLSMPSTFEEIISGNKQREIIYQDDYVVAFVPLRKQAPIHFLIVPQKKISTLNETSEEDALMLGHMMLAAKEYDIADSGYPVSMKTNENTEQSVFIFTSIYWEE